MTEMSETYFLEGPQKGCTLPPSSHFEICVACPDKQYIIINECFYTAHTIKVKIWTIIKQCTINYILPTFHMAKGIFIGFW